MSRTATIEEVGNGFVVTFTGSGTPPGRREVYIDYEQAAADIWRHLVRPPFDARTPWEDKDNV